MSINFIQPTGFNPTAPVAFRPEFFAPVAQQGDFGALGAVSGLLGAVNSEVGAINGFLGAGPQGTFGAGDVTIHDQMLNELLFKANEYSGGISGGSPTEMALASIRSSTGRLDNNLIINIADIPDQRAFNAIQGALGTSALTTTFVNQPTEANPFGGFANVVAGLQGAGAQLGSNPLLALLGMGGIGGFGQAAPQQQQNPLLALLGMFGLVQPQVQQQLPPPPNPMQMLMQLLGQMLGLG